MRLQPRYSPFNARPADGVVIAAIEAGFDPDPFSRARLLRRCEDELTSPIPTPWQKS
jgi:hypothetical protein